MDSRVRACPEQLLTLLEYMESHGDLAKPSAGAQGRLRSDRLWADLTNTLNTFDGGVNKTTDKWKKVWADWKSKTKKKALTIRHHARGNADGLASKQTLSATDERVLAISRSQFLAPLSLPVTQEEEFVDPYLNLEIVHETPKPPASPQDFTSQTSNIPSTTTPQIETPPGSLMLATPSPQEQTPDTPSPPALPAQTAPSPRPPASRRRPRLRTPQSAVSPSRSRFCAHRKRPQTPLERAAGEFTSIELRRLELEETRTRFQHERDMRALEIEHERNQVFASLVNVAQTFLDHFRSRDNNTDNR